LRVLDAASGASEVIDAGARETMEVQGWGADPGELLVVRTATSQAAGEIGLLRLSDRQFRLAGPVQRMADADLSPDGSRIILSELAEADPTRRVIRFLEVSSRRSGVLLKEFDSYSSRWTPDGGGIVFLSDRDGKPGVWHVPVDRGWIAGTPRLVSHASDAMLRIVGVATDGTIFVGVDDVGGQQAYVAAADWTSGAVTDVAEIMTPPFTGARRAVFSPERTADCVFPQGARP